MVGSVYGGECRWWVGSVDGGEWDEPWCRVLSLARHLHGWLRMSLRRRVSRPQCNWCPPVIKISVLLMLVAGVEQQVGGPVEKGASQHRAICLGVVSTRTQDELTVATTSPWSRRTSSFLYLLICCPGPIGPSEAALSLSLILFIKRHDLIENMSWQRTCSRGVRPSDDQTQQLISKICFPSHPLQALHTHLIRMLACLYIFVNVL